MTQSVNIDDLFPIDPSLLKGHSPLFQRLFDIKCELSSPASLSRNLCADTVFVLRDMRNWQLVEIRPTDLNSDVSARIRLREHICLLKQTNAVAAFDKAKERQVQERESNTIL